MKRIVTLELENHPSAARCYNVNLVLSDDHVPLGIIRDHGGWAVGNCHFEEGEIDASKVEDVVTIIISRMADLISNRLNTEKACDD